MMDSYEIVTKIKKRQISELLSQNKRLDGRGLTDYREIKVETGFIDQAAGSALVSLGNTKVLVGIKIETGKPFPDKPEEGVLIVNSEFVPLASPTFETGPPREDSVQLSRVVDRGIREAKVIDTKKLCIVPGKNVFLVFVDIYVLDHDGNLIDASALASISALLNTKMKEYVVTKKGELKFKKKSVKLPITNYPVEVTMVKINDKLIVDPSLEEEMASDTQITIAIDKDDKICAMQKSRIGTLTPADITEAVKTAKIKAKELREKFLKGIIADE